MIDHVEYLAIRMYRPDLKGLPRHPLPDGFRLRLFRRDDRRTWLDIWQAAERYERITVGVFNRSMGYDMPAMPRRCMFLVAPDGRDVGTATAWYWRDPRGQRWGRLHWVGIIPEFQGLGLSKPLVAAAMDLMLSLRHRRAFLVTQTRRIAAIRTYLYFGFLPHTTNDVDRRAWRIVRQFISHPDLASM